MEIFETLEAAAANSELLVDRRQHRVTNGTRARHASIVIDH